MPIFWKVGSALELVQYLCVCAAVNDGASPNRKVFCLHSILRHAIFLQCHASSISLQILRIWWRLKKILVTVCTTLVLIHAADICGNMHILVKHIADLFYSDQNLHCTTLPKLIMHGSYIYSKMKVKLATQVLSRSVSVSMEESGNEGVLGTAYTVLYDDEWFLWLYKCEVTDWTCQENKSFHQTIQLPRWRAIHVAERCLSAVPGELEEVYPCTPRKVFKLKQVKTTFLNLSSIKHVVCALFRLYHRMNQLAWTTIYVFLLKI